MASSRTQYVIHTHGQRSRSFFNTRNAVRYLFRCFNRDNAREEAGATSDWTWAETIQDKCRQVLTRDTVQEEHSKRRASCGH